jgi:tetratricopeptide (TPR) repeat protein
LEKDLHLLPLIKGRAVIIAVDTVLPVLLKNGIKPHFVTTIDPQELVFEKIADALPEVTSDIHLISTISGFPKIPKTFPGGQIFWVFSAKPVEAWLSRLLGCEILTAGAGTVAHLNLLAAVFMKCSPIIFIGQDLAHSRSRSHVPGVSLTAQNKTKEMLKKNKDIQWVKGVDGKPVPTDRAFMDMKHYFERIISENPGHYINATSKGVHIEGTTVLSFTETLKRYALKQYFISDQMKVLSQKRSLSKKELFMNTCADLISDIEVVRSQILKYNKMLSKTIKQVHKLAGSGQQVRCFRDLPAILQKSIQKIDEQSNKIDKAPKIWELVQELTMEALRDSERQKQMISRLAEKPDHYLQWLTVNLDRAETINNVRKDTLQAFHSNLSQAFDFYKKEQRLSQAVSTTEQDNENVEALIRLADLYMDFENFHLAKPLFEKIQITCPDRADTYYKLGIMALHQTHHEMAEKYFKRAIELHPPFETKVMKVRHDFGDIYLSYANLDILDRSVRRRMAIKGIRYCKHHDELRKLINQMASEDLNRIESKNNTEELNEVEDLINFWSDVATREPEGYAGLSVEMRDKFCVYAGKLAWSRGDLEDAKTKIRLVLGKNPDHVEGLQVMAEICFAANNFESGVQYLQQAVSLDLTCAVLWEFVGDRLLAADQPADAAAAYEQCFLYFPEKSELLKKIGECYLALENYDAARQALQIFRDRQPG